MRSKLLQVLRSDTVERLFWTLASAAAGWGMSNATELTDNPTGVIILTGIANAISLAARRNVSVLPSPGDGLVK